MLLHPGYLIAGGLGGSFTPTDLGPSLKLWLDAADFATVTKDSSDKVSQWDDKSGNSNNAVQATEASQPTWIESAIGGKASIRGAGNTAQMNIPDLGLNGLSDVTLFMVINIDSTGGTFRCPLCFGTNANGRLENGGGGDTGLLRTQGIGFLANGVTIVTGLEDSDNVFTLVTDSSNVNAFRNGTSTFSGSSIGNWTTAVGDYGILGSTNGLKEILADIGELIIYTKALSNAERKQVEGYLSAKWGI